MAVCESARNQSLQDLIQRADISVKGEIETLIAGETIEKQIHEDITYADIYDSEDNLWNFLFFTGYLKQVSRRLLEGEQYITMAIPNTEVRSIYREKIVNWFRDKIKVLDLSAMYQALISGDAAVFQEELTQPVRQSISYMDSQESFYHGFLLGVLGNMREYLIRSNREAGKGRSDICVKSLDVSQPPAILELKVSASFKGMESGCEETLAQIHEKNYDEELPEEGYTEVLHYGIAFFRKQCMVKAGRKKLQ